VSRCSPFVVVLSEADRVVLEERVRGYTAPFAVVVRARIVLLAAQGATNVGIAERLDVDADTVSKWRKRFATEGLAGLKDRQRSGRPRTFPAEVVAEVKAMACEPPQARAVPLSRWSSAELAAQAVTEGLLVSMSASTVRRWLAADAIKPWQHRSWIFPRDPDFAASEPAAAGRPWPASPSGSARRVTRSTHRHGIDDGSCATVAELQF
jgi:transposase